MSPAQMQRLRGAISGRLPDNRPFLREDVSEIANGVAYSGTRGSPRREGTAEPRPSERACAEMTSMDCQEISIEFGQQGNDSEFVLDGWAGPDSNHRWAVGSQSALRFGPVCSERNVLLTIGAAPYRCAKGLAQGVIVLVNNANVGRIEMTSGRDEFALFLRANLFFQDRENFIRFLYRSCACPSGLPGDDQRELAVSFDKVVLQPTDFEVLASPRLLPRLADPERTPESLKELAGRFQSLGQNCEVGLWQRRCGSELQGLLRFSSIRLHKLLWGVRTGFNGIDDPDKLSLRCSEPGGEYMGHHSFYGLDYHTFRKEGQIDPEIFAPKERARLRYLAAMLMEELKAGEKIFVIHGGAEPLNQDRLIPLFMAVKAHNSEARLLYVSTVGSEFSALVNRVEECGRGLFHGYLRRFAPNDQVPTFDFEGWTEVCASVAAVIG
jgi:hypothetical protein